jgi:hypothetical protein
MVETRWICDLCQESCVVDHRGLPSDWSQMKVVWENCSRTGTACRKCLVHHTPKIGLLKFWRNAVRFLKQKPADEPKGGGGE